MKKKAILLFLSALLISCLAFSQKKTAVSASVDKTEVLIGEQFHLTLEATFPGASSPSFFGIDSLPHFEIMLRSKIDTQDNVGSIRLSRRYTLTSWDSGRWQLPAFSLPYASGTTGPGKAKPNKAKAATIYKTTPITISVGYTPFDATKDYHDIKDILYVQQPEKARWYWYVILGALFLAIAALIFPRKKKGPAEDSENKNAYKTAIAELRKLKKEQSSKDAKTFYVTLVDVFRKYLHQRKGIQSFSKTTDDLAVQIKSLQLPKELYNGLLQTLRLSDAVKFARYQPGDGENDPALQTIEKSIDAIENL